MIRRNEEFSTLPDSTLGLYATRSLEIVSEILIAALLVFAPLAFGTVEAWSQEIFLATIGTIALLAAIKPFLDPDSRPIWTLAYVPITLFVSLVLFQLVPLPAATLAKFALGTLQTKTALQQQLGNAILPDDHVALSFYSLATVTQLRLLVGIITIFVVVLHTYRDIRKIRRLLITITVVGLFVAVMALYQNLSGTMLIYGTVPMAHRNAGPFMNYSHFSQFVNLSIGAAIALLLMWSTDLKSRFSLRSDTLIQLREPSNWYIWIAFTMCIAGPIAVMLSMSRMGMLSMFVAAIITMLLLGWRNRWGGQNYWLVIILLAVLACTLLTTYDVIARRLSTVQNSELVAGTRIQILKDIADEFRLFPLFGIGLGNHEYVYSMFSHLVIPQVTTHAENEYAQVLEECGAAGLAIVLSFVAFVAINFFKAIWSPRTSLQLGIYGLGFGLITVLVHSCSDFGQHMPADALLTAIFAALLITVGSAVPRQKPRQNSIARPQWLFRSAATTAATGILIGVFAWIISGADFARRAESKSKTSIALADKLEIKHWQGSDEEYRDLLNAAGDAAKLSPQNVKYACDLNVYRWHTIARTTDSQSPTLSIPSAALAFVPQLITAFKTTAELCPSYGPPLSMLGQIKLFVLNDRSGAADIEAAYRLSPGDRFVCEMAAMVDARQGKWDESLHLFQRYIALHGSPRDALDFYLSANAQQLAFELASGHRDRLMYLVDRSKSDASLARLQTRCEQDATALLNTEVHGPEASADSLADYAKILQSNGNPSQAVVWYRKALDRDYGQISWRLGLAQALADVGQRDQAMRELRICKNLSSDSQQIAHEIAQVKLRGSDDMAAE